MDLKENYNYFLENIKEFYEGHKDEYVVIKDCKVLGFYESFEKAAEETMKKHEMGTFIIQKCVSDPNEDAATFHSRVVA